MQPEDKTETLENVRLLGEQGKTVEAHNPLNRHSAVRQSLSVPQIHSGYSFSIAQSLAYGKWKLYDEVTCRIRQVPETGALKWHQGASDAGNTGAHKTGSSSLAENLRQDLGASDVFFIAGKDRLLALHGSRF